MYIARVLYPVRVLGPGDRVGIWFCGCDHRCKGCSNPELWYLDERYQTDTEQIMHLIKSIRNDHVIDGFTITGGDPMKQPSALKALLPRLAEISEDILMYTGFEYDVIRDSYCDLLKSLAVLIDGPYIEGRNKEELLRGSDNQKIIILKEAYREKYNRYMTSDISRIQNFYTPTGTISVGIHRPGYEQELDRILREKGLRPDE